MVGSGASCSYGLPGMGALAAHLRETVPLQAGAFDEDSVNAWERVASALDGGKGLEEALGSGGVPNVLADILTEITARFVQDAEGSAIESIVTDPAVSAFGRLFVHLLKVSDVVEVVTTNYDRLIEVHAAKAGVRIDSMFYGHTIGRLDEELSRGELLKREIVPGKGARYSLRLRPHIRISKPHGSLDWFASNDDHYRSDLNIPGARLIVAPGGNKYRLGYDVPFDQQRNRANSAINGASAMLFVGYGFNDDHLQTHLKRKFPEVPSVILAHKLTDSSRKYLRLNPHAIGIESVADGSRSALTRGADQIEIDGAIWDLEVLNKEVLGI